MKTSSEREISERMANLLVWYPKAHMLIHFGIGVLILNDFSQPGANPAEYPERLNFSAFIFLKIFLYYAEILGKSVSVS